MGDLELLEPALLDPLVFDRRVANVVAKLGRASRRLLREGPAEVESPFLGERAISSKATLDAMGDLARDPLFAALRRWSIWLTVERVTLDDRAAFAEALHAQSVHRDIDDTPRSFSEIRRELLVEPGESPRRHTLARSLAASARPMQPSARRWAERRREAQKRLGSTGDTAPSAKLARDVIALVAKSGALALGARMSREVRPDAHTRLASIVDATLARDATEGWPARITLRWIADLFQGSELTRGLALDLHQADLPTELGGASFGRALGLFGEALFDADRPRDLPFSLARAPRDPRRHARGYLFGLLPATSAFGRAHLGLGADRARDQARKLGRAFAVHAALLALAVLVEDVIAEPDKIARARFEELTAEALGEPLDGGLVGALPLLRPEADLALLGVLGALVDEDALREAFDEDWFRNPRAHEALRHAHAEPAIDVDATSFDAKYFEAKSIESQMRLLARRLGEAAG